MDSLSYDLWSWGQVFESISRSSLSSSRDKLYVAIAFNIILIGSSRQDREQLSTDRSTDVISPHQLRRLIQAGLANPLTPLTRQLLY